MRRRSVLLLATALGLAATACGSDGDGAAAIRATASAQLTTTTSTTAVPPPVESTTTSSTSPPPVTSTTVRATTTTRPRVTTTTARPTTTAPPPPTTPTTRFPGDTRRAVPWDRYTASTDGRTLTFSYYSGVPPCSIEDGMQVEETSATVRVTIYERDGSQGQPCIALAQQKFATATLATPLGNRTVVDGARS